MPHMGKSNCNDSTRLVLKPDGTGKQTGVVGFEDQKGYRLFYACPVQGMQRTGHFGPPWARGLKKISWAFHIFPRLSVIGLLIGGGKPQGRSSAPKTQKNKISKELRIAWAAVYQKTRKHAEIIHRLGQAAGYQRYPKRKT